MEAGAADGAAALAGRADAAADGDRDNAVPPVVSDQAAAKMRSVTVRHLPGYGHLAQEEAADGLAAEILPWLAPRLQEAMVDSAPKIS